MAGRSSHTSSGARSVLVVLAVVAAAATALLAPAAAAAAPRPFPVSTQFGGQAGPEIAGAMAVWTDNRKGNLDIYGRNLSTGRDYAVCTNRSQQDNPSVTRYVTAGGKVRYVAVWVDKRNHAGGDASDIYGRDITRRRNFVVSRSAAIKWFPEIVDRWVIWIEADDAAGPYRIKARDLAAARTYTDRHERRAQPGRHRQPHRGLSEGLHGRLHVRQGQHQRAQRARREAVRDLARSTFEWMPDISHNRVVWWESGGRIMMRNLKTRVRTFVHRGSRPRIDGALVVWDSGGHGGTFVTEYVTGARIYVRNVARGTRVVAIAQPNLTCLFPAISGRRLVWESGPALRILSHIHIYGARL